MKIVGVQKLSIGAGSKDLKGNILDGQRTMPRTNETFIHLGMDWSDGCQVGRRGIYAR